MHPCGIAKTVYLPPIRYPPSSRQTSHEEGKEWLRSHSTGGLQDTGSPLSPPGTTSTNAGKYHYSNLRMSTHIISDLHFTVEHNYNFWISHYTMNRYWDKLSFCDIMTYVLQWVPPVCHSIIFPAPVWAVPTVFQHRIHSSCTGRVTLWAAVPPRWRNGHAGWVGPVLSETAQMKVSIDVTSFRRINLFIYIRTIDMPYVVVYVPVCVHVC